MKRWLEEVDRLEGAGTLRDASGRAVPVSYDIRVRRHMREESALGGATIRTAGHYDLSGVLIRDPNQGFINPNETLLLTIDDGRTVEIIPRVIGDPWAPIPFQVSRHGNVLVAHLPQ